MGIVIGIDIGGSTTKIVGFRDGKNERTLMTPLFVKSTDPITSVYGAFGKFIDCNGLALSDVDKPLLIDSRMAWHFVRDTFRVYLSTEVAVSAARILGAGRAEEQFASVEEAEEKIRQRRDSEKKRYMELYGVNNKDPFNYDLVLDTTYATPAEIAACIADSFRPR